MKKTERLEKRTRKLFDEIAKNYAAMARNELAIAESCINQEMKADCAAFARLLVERAEQFRDMQVSFTGD